MAKYYEKTKWENGSEGGTPLSAENLNKMEEGISDAEMRTGSLEYNKETNSLATETSVGGCKGYYIKSIDLINKKIYLSDIKVIPTIETTDNLDVSFETPAYDIGDNFTILNDIHYVLCASIATIKNNVITYNGDLGFTEIAEDTAVDGHTFFVPSKPTVGSIVINYESIALGMLSIAAGRQSFVAGRECIAIDNWGTAFGYACIAAYMALAVGSGSKALKEQSIALGAGAVANAVAAFASGAGTKASGHSSTAMGEGTQASGEYATSLGNGTKAKGRSSLSTGEGTKADGDYSFSGGVGSNATKKCSFVYGEKCYCETNYSTVFGLNNVAGGTNQTIFGKNNSPFNAGNVAFMIGIGKTPADKDRKNGLELDWNGNLRIAGQLQDITGKNLLVSDELMPFVVDGIEYYCPWGMTWEHLQYYKDGEIWNTLGFSIINNYVGKNGRQIEELIYFPDGSSGTQKNIDYFKPIGHKNCHIYYTI